MKATRVLFIVPYPSEGASNRLRVEQYLPFLEKESISYRVRPFVGRRFYRILYAKGRHLTKAFYFLLAIINRLLDIFRAFKFDVIFIHREALPIGTAFIEKIFSMTGKRIVFDFDDAIFLPNTSRTNNYIELLKNPNKVSEIMGLSGCVIAGNEYLMEYAKKFNRNVAIIPTPIDTKKYTPSKSGPGRDGVTIGWVGSFTTGIYLEAFRPVMERLKARYPRLKFKFVGNWTGSEDRIDGAEYKEWTLDDELEDIRSFDIGIMPMPDDMWTKGKCGFKIILYMACAIPVVSSPVGVNKDIIADGVNGFLANTQGEWFEKLSGLIEDPHFRRRVGAAGRKTVEERYCVSRTAPLFIKALSEP